ncbi:hypothetical protein A5636_17165 [Mycobacterium asiaticum]|uniref:Uncharacterized protein n=1 Tax=Mycobacterium asiaticum TaxID=1790 RepID=A0A1A3NCR7_MYCAS|nr:hypothetical protein A5636_17165 [Mycobacterium asiaticum]
MTVAPGVADVLGLGAPCDAGAEVVGAEVVGAEVVGAAGAEVAGAVGADVAGAVGADVAGAVVADVAGGAGVEVADVDSCRVVVVVVVVVVEVVVVADCEGAGCVVAGVDSAGTVVVAGADSDGTVVVGSVASAGAPGGVHEFVGPSGADWVLGGDAGRTVALGSRFSTLVFSWVTSSSSPCRRLPSLTPCRVLLTSASCVWA